MYGLKLKSPSTIEKLIKNGMNIENSLVAKGVIKINKGNNNLNNSSDKNKFWSKNKDVTNDGVVDTRIVSMNKPKFFIKGSSASNTQASRQTQQMYNQTSNIIHQPQNQQHNQQQQGQQQGQQCRLFRSRDGPPR